ncbi:hypothetical protein [Ralstonia pseudosolanacearum]|uniref:hypothetical protein n=1 Tax=Ralstonia pseudosolanacearum TaxID=1310165 RepID=UPI003D078179
MIKKKNNTYRLIKKDIAKLAIIQQTTEVSPSRLVSIFLNNQTLDDILFRKKTKEGYWDWTLADNTAYKYFNKQLSSYLRRSADGPSFRALEDHFKSAYLTKEYFGANYESLVDNYYAQEQPLKDFVRSAFIAINPLTPKMSPKEIAIRNQRLGKISVKHWIGDITNYDYFSQAPGFMINNVQQALQYIDLYIMNLLREQELDSDLMKLSTNQRLETRLTPKSDQTTNKPMKI